MTTVALVGFISLGVLLLAGALLAALDIWAMPSRSQRMKRRDSDLFVDQWRSERRWRLREQQDRPSITLDAKSETVRRQVESIAKLPPAPAVAGPRSGRHPLYR